MNVITCKIIYVVRKYFIFIYMLENINYIKNYLIPI